MMIGKVRMLMAALSVLGTIGVGANSARAATAQVPFMGSYAGTVAFTSATTVAFSGNGISRLLGFGTNHGIAVITGPDSSCPGGLANVNTETLAGANGDSLTLTSYDVACPMSPGVYHGTGHWVVAGGTGRFSGATGKGSVDAHSDFNTGHFVFVLLGAISTPMGM